MTTRDDISTLTPDTPAPRAMLLCDAGVSALWTSVDALASLRQR